MDTSPPTVDYLLRIAREDIARNSLSSAQRTLEQVILANKDIPDAFHLLGYVYSKTGKLKKAMLAFQRALELDPFHTEAAIALSALYNDVGRYKEGAALFMETKQRLAQHLPGHDPRINQNLSERHYETGLLYLRFERFREAYHEFTKAMNLDPENPQYPIQMAKCLAKIGDKDAALGLLKKSLERNPSHIDTKIQLGVILHTQQQLKMAEREWREALALDPENSSAQMYLSMLDYE